MFDKVLHHKIDDTIITSLIWGDKIVVVSTSDMHDAHLEQERGTSSLETKKPDIKNYINMMNILEAETPNLEEPMDLEDLIDDFLDGIRYGWVDEEDGRWYRELKEDE